ncbi:dCTP deaminase [Streptomyces sp. Amel2xB2]|uniref:Deoxycytidine triphosphate deaminase n=1 Tax=Streptomyces nanshensis TaxID=518642 RepID=A0A1E7KCW0_9ACTN|nr:MULTISPECIES: dCTP deaminase [Streptomyces]OEV01759.1 deoxycytidine triphosphate deaminase [Streptomyces nanshensis]RAJ67172.1 dCTP deaminase [Streptomyces sp. Amel2xB2]
MILSGHEIERQIELGAITAKPFDPELINPNSIDLTLDDTILRYRDPVIDPRVEPEVVEEKIPEDGLFLEPMSFCLGSSREIVGSTEFVPMVHAKSSTARAGLFVHVTADLIDIGSIGTVTFQLFSTLGLRVYPHMRLGQMTFWKPKGEITLYSGKYQGSRGPRKSEIFRDRYWETQQR